MKQYDKRIVLISLIPSTLLSLYLALIFSPVFDSSSFSKTLDNLDEFDMLHLKFTRETPKLLLFFLVIEMLAYAYVIAMQKNRKDGREYGTQRLKNQSDLNRKIQDKKFENNRILTQNIRLSVTGRETLPSLNTLVVGGMGSGKSFYTLLANLLQANTSFVVLDPSKQLSRWTAWFLKKIRGYDVKILDLVDLIKSHRYNFFRYIRDEKDILRISKIIFKATVEKERRTSTSDPMWENMAEFYLEALIALIWYRGLPEEQNIETLIWLADEDFLLQDQKTGARIATPVTAMMEDLERRVPGNLATRAYAAATDGDVITIRGVKSTFRGRLGMFSLQSVQKLMEYDDMDLYDVGKRKTAIFLCAPIHDRSLNFLVTLLWYQLIGCLYEVAMEPGRNEKLPVPVQFMNDEQKNFVVPEEFPDWLTSMRKHGVSFMMFYQEFSQIEKQFGREDADTIIGTCQSFVYLGGSGKKSNKEISEWIGNETITVTNYSISHGRSGHAQRSESRQKSEVLTPQQVEERIGRNNALVHIEGIGWSIDRKYDVTRHPNFQYSTAAGGEGELYDSEAMDNVCVSAISLKRVADQSQECVYEMDLDRIDSFKLRDELELDISA